VTISGEKGDSLLFGKGGGGGRARQRSAYVSVNAPIWEKERKRSPTLHFLARKIIPDSSSLQKKEKEEAFSNCLGWENSFHKDNQWRSEVAEEEKRVHQRRGDEFSSEASMFFGGERERTPYTILRKRRWERCPLLP